MSFDGRTTASVAALDTQVGGDHYKDMGIQPLEAVLANYGYVGLEAAVYCKVLKYMGRDKGSKVENLRKASHVLDILIEAAQAEESYKGSEETPKGTPQAIYNALQSSK